MRTGTLVFCSQLSLNQCLVRGRHSVNTLDLLLTEQGCAARPVSAVGQLALKLSCTCFQHWYSDPICNSAGIFQV